MLPLNQAIPPARKAVWMLVASATFFGIMAFLTKILAASIGGSQIATVRFAIGILVILAIPRLRTSALTFQRVDLLFYRGVLGGIAVLLYFISIEHIPVGVATMLNYTSPIFSGLLAALFLGEKLHARLTVPLLIALTGVFLVAHGQAAEGEWIHFGRWEAFGLASGVLSGAALTAIRVARRTESSWAIFGSFTLFGFIATVPFGIAGWRTPDIREWILLVLIAVVSIAAQMLMTSALRWVPMLVAGVLSQGAVIVSLLLGVFVLNDGLGWVSLAGTLMTLAGVLAVIVVGERAKNRAFEEAAEQ